MIQTSVVAPIATRLPPATLETDLPDPLWRLTGELRTAHALVIAEHGLDLLCGLIRRGCLAATVLRPGDKLHDVGYDLVIVPQASALASSDHLIRLARRSLVANGRLIVGTSDARAAAALARRLRLNGFAGLRSVHLPNRVLLRADLRRPA